MTVMNQSRFSDLLPLVKASQPFSAPPKSIPTLRLFHHLQHRSLRVSRPPGDLISTACLQRLPPVRALRPPAAPLNSTPILSLQEQPRHKALQLLPVQPKTVARVLFLQAHRQHKALPPIQALPLAALRLPALLMLRRSHKPLVRVLQRAAVKQLQ